MNSNQADIIVIGSGPAGLEAATRLAAGSLTVTLLTTTPPGGRATVGSLVPSKGWLHAIHHGRAALGDDEGVARAAASIRELVAERVRASEARLRGHGVRILRGVARVSDENAVTFRPLDSDGAAGEAQTLQSRAVVLATGSEPTFAPDLKPDGQRMIAPRHTQHMTGRPSSMIVAGGGITGVEYGSVFAGMGLPVELIASREVLPNADREHVARLLDRLREQGMQVTSGRRVERAISTESGVTATLDDGSERRASHLFLGTGRAGDLSVLEGATVKPETHSSGAFLRVDSEGRSSIPGLWACGDLTGGPLTATRAVLQARRLAGTLRAELGDLPDHESPDALPPAADSDTAFTQVVYTDPQLAQIGPVGELATRGDLRLERRSYRDSVTGSLEQDDGELKLWVSDTGQIAGASAIGGNAAELLAPVQLAMHHGISATALSAAPFAYPSFAEIVTL